MHLSRLSVQHVRTHQQYSLTLSPSITLITGENGSGKTSLIEAVYVALQGKSFKGTDVDILQHSSDWYRIDLISGDESSRTVKFEPARLSGKKQFNIDGKTHYRLPSSQKYPVVLFEPDDLRLLNGSPARRRLFIDQFISQLDPVYQTTLRRYERALKQRNALLKQSRHTRDDLFAWNVSLSDYGARIIEKRRHCILALNEKLQSIYQSIAESHDTLSIEYSYAAPQATSQHLLRELEAHTARDALLGYTTTGPHRHDVLFSLNSTPATHVASRGEIRTIVLALKFLEVSIIKSQLAKQPIVLLDDVFSELDAKRQNRLLQELRDSQIILTSATSHVSLPPHQTITL